MLVLGTSISPGVTGALSAAICVPIVFALLRKSHAYKYVGVAQAPKSDDETTGRYRQWDHVSRLLVILFAGIFGYLFWLMFCAIETARTALLGSANFVLTPLPIFFVLPALFAGILFAAIPLKFVLTKILGSDGYDRLVDYSDRRQGINSKRLFRDLVIIGVTLIVASVLLAFQTYATASAEGLTIHPYFAIHEREYGWSDISRITLVKSFSAPNGSVRRDRPYYVVEMTDGYRLNFHSTLLEVPFRDQRRLAVFLAEHAHHDVDVEDPFP
jgi:hypothetical protein